MHSELIHTEERDGFEIKFYACEEDTQPSDCFDEGLDEIVAGINNGDLVWFTAKVTASQQGIELADTYLGGCCYESYMQFVEYNDYYADMVAEVIAAAKDTIAKFKA